jgi:uncharacterized protein (TIGR02145 family)
MGTNYFSVYRKSKLKTLGIFVFSLLIATSAIYFYSPTFLSHAEEKDLDVNVNVNPIISLNLDTNSVSFDITPTAAGVFDSASIVATVDTNSTGGYELYFSSEDSDTDMTSLVSESVIASDFSSTVTSSTMAANKWGYSTDATNFAAIPALADQVALKNLDHYPASAEKTSTVNFGVKINAQLPSGSYSKTVVFTAIAHPSLEPNRNRLVELTSMQDPNLAGYCSETYTPISATAANITSKAFLEDRTPTATLQDLRDGKSYTVKKLADGKCWMTENLAIIDWEISDEDSNLPANTSFTIPTSDKSAISSVYNTPGAYTSSNYGTYYNFFTATAGWGTDQVTSGNSPKDICPKGWKMPTSSGDFQTLWNKYNSRALMGGIPDFQDTGRIYNTNEDVQGRVGFFWSSTVAKWNDASYLAVRDNSTPSTVDINSFNKYYGLSVRCLAK